MLIFRYNNPNGSVTFKFGNATNTVTAYDGFGRRDDTTVSNLRPILDNNNNPVYITCDAKGYGETAYKFPYDDNYVLVEVQAPVGYAVNHHSYTVSLILTLQADFNILRKKCLLEFQQRSFL